MPFEVYYTLAANLFAMKMLCLCLCLFRIIAARHVSAVHFLLLRESYAEGVIVTEKNEVTLFELKLTVKICITNLTFFNLRIVWRCALSLFYCCSTSTLYKTASLISCDCKLCNEPSACFKLYYDIKLLLFLL
jgi:hypothetical protein